MSMAYRIPRPCRWHLAVNGQYGWPRLGFVCIRSYRPTSMPIWMQALPAGALCIAAACYASSGLHDERHGVEKKD